MYTAWSKKYGYQVRIPLEKYEEEDRFLEGTGSMILDRPEKLAYACRSPRTDEGLFREFCRRKDYRPILFDAVDQAGLAIYHTNVMMALAETFVVICLDSVASAAERKVLLDSFKTTGKEVVNISFAQMMAFAGNMLQVKGAGGQPFLVMSSQAYQSLNEGQLQQIRNHCPILHSPLDVIEAYGGGSARCMMAEVFLPH